MLPKITIGSTAEKRWLLCLADERYGLEEGHSNWYPIDDGFRCRSCAARARTNPDVDPEYEVLKGPRTGGYLSRPDTVLATDCQPNASGV